MRDFRSFTFWHDSIQLSADLCILTREFPREEKYALGDQIRRASVSIASNIAEGAGRSSDSDFTHFLDISLGSSYEVETQLYIANKLGYIDKSELSRFVNSLSSIQRRITSFIIKTRKVETKGSVPAPPEAKS